MATIIGHIEDKETVKPTSIKIGNIKDKNSLKFKLAKKADKLKKTLHSHIIDTLNAHGI